MNEKSVDDKKYKRETLKYFSSDTHSERQVSLAPSRSWRSRDTSNGKKDASDPGAWKSSKQGKVKR